MDRNGRPESASAESAVDWGPELDALLREGSVQEKDLERGLWTLLERGTQHGEVGADRSAEAREIHLRLREWDRYRDLTLIGLGGGGAVFEAYDPRLNRKVALKFLWSRSADLLARLVREAKAQAQIEHPHVVKVYEVDSAFGLWFISMQLVRGRNLLQLAPDLPVAQCISLLAQAAEAAHAAHRLGMAHLDLKPGNILVERSGQGVLWAYLADFGLAQGKEADGESRVPLGTPPYSSPEQMRGEALAIDRRSDVYSLGVCLYRLVSGQLPFGNLDPRIFQDRSPVPAISLGRRSPELPSDLVAIVEKAMAWEPSDRYESAQALAADLDRFLNGEPVLAQGRNWRYALAKRLRKNRLLVSVAALSALALLAMGGLTLQTQRKTSRQVERAQLFGRRAEQIDSQLWREYALPLHDVQELRNRVRGQLEEMAKELETFGPEASGPGRVALGRGLINLGEFGSARTQLQQAWDGGHRSSECRYLLGLSLGHLYKEGLDSAMQVQDPALRSARVARLEQELRDPALAMLRATGPDHQDPPEYVRGLVALYERRYGEALELAEGARSMAPWFHQAFVLSAEVNYAMAVEKVQQGDFDTFDRCMEEAGRAFRQAIEIARSNPEALARWAVVATRKVEIKAYQQGRWSEAEYREARTACRAALRANPKDPWLLDRLAWAALAGARHRTDRNQDPGPFFRDAQEALGQAIQVDPRHGESWLIFSRIAYQRALWSSSRDLDPRPDLAQAVHFAERAVATNPGNPRAAGDLGMAHLELAYHCLGTGQDPLPSATLALEALRRAGSMGPADAGALTHIIAADNIVARTRLERGEDPGPALREAREALEKSLVLAPRSYWVHRNAVGLEYLSAWAEHRAGGDLRSCLERARAHEAAAVAVIPDGEEVLWYSMVFGRIFTAAVAPPGSRERREAVEGAQRALARLHVKPGLLRTLRWKIQTLDYSAS